MPVRARTSGRQVVLQPLTKDEIDRRIERLIADLAADPGAEVEGTGAGLQPRFLSPAELVRRMRPFLGNN